MNLLKNTKILALIVMMAVAVLLYMAYSSLTNSTADSSTTMTSPVSQELLVALSNLHTIHLEGSLFEDPVFQSLSDFGVVIPAQPVGRRNPFEPM